MTGMPGSGSSTIGPNEQTMLAMDWAPHAVTLTNMSPFDGSFVFVWLYPDTTPVTPTEQPLLSGASLPLAPPPPSPAGNPPRALVLFNVGGAQIEAS